MEKPRLYGTPLSHFTRKIRILLAEFGVEFDFARVPGLLDASTATYGDNPLMRIPTLVHAGETIFESDHIARYLVGKYDPSDRFGVRSEDVRDLNRLAVINGVMDNAVILILAKRAGLTDLQGAYFRKLARAIDSGLAWLDGKTDPDRPAFDYGDIVTMCMWQHLTYFKLAHDLDRCRRIAARIARFSGRPSILTTAPEVSLAEAVAAGWEPASER